jgi:threonine dehydratase
MNDTSVPAMHLSQVLSARRVIGPHIWHTPLMPSAALSGKTRSQVYLKLECWQRTGSFKVRGALNRLSALSPQERQEEFVTASAGNHGLGVAYASQVLGLPRVTIFVPENAPDAKLERLQAYNCQVQRAGADYDAAHALAEAHARSHSARYLSAYDDPIVIAGQGTVGLEIMDDLPETDLLLVPVGGGGLIAGLALVARAINPDIQIIGLQPEASPSAYLSLRDGHPYETYPAGPTICDGLAGGFGRVPFAMARDLIDRVLVIPEPDIRQAVVWLLRHEQLLVEGSGAIAIAPLLTGQLDTEDHRVVAVLTGRNVDASMLQQILTEQRNAHDPENTL